MSTTTETTIEEVREARKYAANQVNIYGKSYDLPTWEQIDFLLAEVDRLKAEVRSLRLASYREEPDA